MKDSETKDISIGSKSEPPQLGVADCGHGSTTNVPRSHRRSVFVIHQSREQAGATTSAARRNAATTHGSRRTQTEAPAKRDPRVDFPPGEPVPDRPHLGQRPGVDDVDPNQGNGLVDPTGLPIHEENPHPYSEDRKDDSVEPTADPPVARDPGRRVGWHGD